MLKRVYLARHQGFCMGVERAINIAEETAQKRCPGERVTILNEIVHNDAVVERFKNDGVDQALSLEDVREGTLIISAHGIAPGVVSAAERKGLKVVDATCPLVTRIYKIILKAIDDGLHIIHFGDSHHDETAGIVGHAPDHITVAGTIEELLALPDWPRRKLGLTVQTTAHENDFREIERLARQKWPGIEVFNTICNATTRRQEAILEMAPLVDMILVVGSQSSANSNRLATISQKACGSGRLIGSEADIKPDWFRGEAGVENIGVSAGASTPQFLVDAVLSRLVQISGDRAEIVHLDNAEASERP